MKEKISKWIMFWVALAISSIGLAQTTVTLKFQDSSTQEIEVSESGKIYFSDDYMFIDDGTALPYSFAVSNIRNMKFSKVLGITDIVTETYKVYPNPAHNELYVSGNEFGPFRYFLYSIDGRLLLDGEIQNNEHIHLGSIPAGLYILKINNTSFKINKI